MNFKKLFIIISALSVTAISCDKDEDTTSLPSLGGRMIVSNLPEFVTPGQRCTLTVKGATHPEGKEVGYYWKTFPTKPGNDTTDTNYITFTDTLQTCTIYCYAFAEGYSSNYTSANVTVVDRERSIKGIQYTSVPIYGTSC